MANQQQQPSTEDIRKARHSGFKNSLSNADQNRADRLTKSYVKQDTRREHNIGTFVQSIRG